MGPCVMCCLPAGLTSRSQHIAEVLLLTRSLTADVSLAPVRLTEYVAWYWLTWSLAVHWHVLWQTALAPSLARGSQREGQQ